MDEDESTGGLIDSHDLIKASDGWTWSIHRDDDVYYGSVSGLKDAVRLFILRPGARSSPLRCCFSTQNLPYETLSYAWGSSAQPSQVQFSISSPTGCIRERETAMLNITANLDPALRALQHLG
jgi:hypothetical protein